VTPTSLRATSLFLPAALLIWCAQSQQNVSEREAVLSALRLSYGQPVNNEKSEFAISGNYLLTPTFSSTGTLIKIGIDPRFGPGSSKSPPLSRPIFEAVLANLNSIKPLGAFAESFGAEFVLGGRAWGNRRYENGYLQTAEPIDEHAPRSVAFAYIYYLHPVTGVGKVPRDSRPEDAGSFGLVCFNGLAYIAPKAAFLKLSLNPQKQVTLNLAGPTGDEPPECEK
jgi:hypothetical protein